MYNRCVVFEYNKTRNVWDPRSLSEKVCGTPWFSHLPGYYYCYYYHYYGTYLFLGGRLLDTPPAYCPPKHYNWKAIACLFSHLRYSIRIVCAFTCRPIVDLSDTVCGSERSAVIGTPPPTVDVPQPKRLTKTFIYVFIKFLTCH